jgi:uncharacterized protein YqgV (UPF0045/DUF77 family)
MAILKINLSQLDMLDIKEANSMGEFVTSLLLLSNERGIKCRLTSSELITEGDKETLLEILHEFDNTSLKKVVNRISLTMKFDESPLGSLT